MTNYNSGRFDYDTSDCIKFGNNANVTIFYITLKKHFRVLIFRLLNKCKITKLFTECYHIFM